ncbi:MAG: polysaccharide pyruvyl transferase CsaB [Armatimonadota bacterium]
MADRQRAAPRRHRGVAGRAGAALDRPAPDRVLVSGYYGFGNLGDEAVLAGLLAEMRARRPDVRMTVLSADPAATNALHGVEAWPRDPAAVWRALPYARLLISGGGSLVQDVTSARSAVYYLGVIAAASARRVPTAVIGQGIGPIRRPWVRALTRWAFNRVQAISLRDPDSIQTLAALGVKRPAHRCADLALLMAPAPQARVRELLTRFGLDAAPARVGIAVRPWPGLNVSSLGEEIRRFATARQAAVAVFPFDRVRDRADSEAVVSAAGGHLVDAVSPQDLLGLVGAMDLLVGVRLHALVFAASQGVSAVGLTYDPKVSAFASQQGLLPVLPVGAPSAAVRQALEAAWDRREELRARLGATLPAARRAAAEAVSVAIDLLTVPLSR